MMKKKNFSTHQYAFFCVRTSCSDASSRSCNPDIWTLLLSTSVHAPCASEDTLFSWTLSGREGILLLTVHRHRLSSCYSTVGTIQVGNLVEVGTQLTLRRRRLRSRWGSERSCLLGLEVWGHEGFGGARLRGYVGVFFEGGVLHFLVG